MSSNSICDEPSPTQEHRTPADILNAAADLLEKPGAWTQGTEARDQDGRSLVWGTDERAKCWCVVGALEWASGRGRAATERAKALYAQSTGIMMECLGAAIPDWNDAPDRTQAEVVAALRKAATLSGEPSQ